MTNDKGPQIGRLAMRQEGEFWNAYYAMPQTMVEAKLLGSIRMRFVVDSARKAAFTDLMREATGDLIEEIAGVRPIWGGPESAPEHERAGSA